MAETSCDPKLLGELCKKKKKDFCLAEVALQGDEGLSRWAQETSKAGHALLSLQVVLR